MVWIMYSIGLMSGTSMDGIDVALIKTDGQYDIASHAHLHVPYTPEAQLLFKVLEYTVQQAAGDLNLAERLLHRCLQDYLHHQMKLSLQEINTLHLAHYLQSVLKDSSENISVARIIHFSTDLHINAVHELQKIISSHPLACIGYHGQTVFHQPAQGKTIQIGLGQHLAAATNLTVIYNFRSNDVALGGQGAPFAPIYHQALAVRDQLLPICIINCGGIANLTLVSGEGLDDIVGFDTGPGNCLLDAYIKKATQGREQMDKNGVYALQGHVHKPTLDLLLQTQYQPHQPALDSHHFTLIPELAYLSRNDACATLVSFTVECIIHSLLPHHSPPKRYILCGGGAYHAGIRHALAKRLKETIHPQAIVQTADEMGWKNQAIEAELMAYLAVRRLKKLPISLPKTTGVPYPASGGEIALPPRGPTPLIQTLLG